ncbi:polyprenyl synthetase family protein [Buchnera aphidicola]|jgi:farnesyl diphosphate synthase|uniref:Farnesyl diphosphate synthase n=1 Tax=Buchnera aphidicola subsp. Schizaphis graminum (strain Sg) TaxID=198804 RepID=ISPA_BUCAP|nr:polyprenyl synthetase family protein [Buchnera aphidicola]Q8K9A0.1 RecName: Full=Farnesyl diphosphate synthase; Short=FPP synthase; AltName: Full=(2E,6E)-farnesyl diphosphate synthase; AltName: Full=Geranyltranstransferase [Buchnera aphidicola str. Sg (Schizaphis graminum)]AAM67992.1 geranyltranstransferase [Buchnera aphidicola str. Sg (Schizaphis graminum)]AWI49517.1 farnesyl-diphosphate synthase [Buchnera aphidicola (Schizaphis graminum)]
MNFSHLYDIYYNRINKKLFEIIQELPFQDSVLFRAMKYSTLSGGKRLRACLIYATGETFQVNIAALDVISAAVELVHSYSLIHDDLPCIDNDYFRRGKISCHIKYGENFALLAGDALQGLAFNILSNSNMPGVHDSIRLKMIAEFSNAIGYSGMCIGQMLDLEKERKKINISELEKINLYKTAFLIRCSIRLAYFASNNFSKEVLFILDKFSVSIGLAFQIQDDILDLKNDIKKLESKRNKTKNTYPLLIGLKKSKIKIKELYKEAFFTLEILKKNFNVNILKLLTQFIMKRFK